MFIGTMSTSTICRHRTASRGICRPAARLSQWSPCYWVVANHVVLTSRRERIRTELRVPAHCRLRPVSALITASPDERSARSHVIRSVASTIFYSATAQSVMTWPAQSRIPLRSVPATTAPMLRPDICIGCAGMLGRDRLPSERMVGGLICRSHVLGRPMMSTARLGSAARSLRLAFDVFHIHIGSSLESVCRLYAVSRKPKSGVVAGS